MIVSARNKAILQALFVTVLWSSSWVFIKIGLQGMPPLTFAGFRYFLGFVILVPFVLRNDFKSIAHLNRTQWVELFGLGFIMYFATQGAQFLSLAHFPAVFTALILNFSPVVVALLSFLVLKEKASHQQVAGIFICLLGACLYFVPHLSVEIQISWLLIIPVGGMIANSASSILGRAINRKEHLAPKVVTVTSMGIGSILLLSIGLATETFPVLTTQQILIIVWLAGINTAFAFTLWNHTLRKLSSVESSVINNTMMIQIAILAVTVLGESLTALDVLALSIASVGAFIVQVKRPIAR